MVGADAVEAEAVADNRPVFADWSEDMNSKPPEIFIITEHYFFLKTPLLTQTETRIHRKRKFEKKARKAIMRLSKQDTHSSTNFLEEDQNEMTTWIRLAITECSKIKKQG